MKQRITIEQLHGLSQKGKEKLREWWHPKHGDMFLDGAVEMVVAPAYSPSVKSLPLLSIGQMIEYLNEVTTLEEIQQYKNIYFTVTISNKYTDQDWFDEKGEEVFHKTFHADELCDALWEAVKEVLES